VIDGENEGDDCDEVIELSILESCCLRPIMRNSVLEELRVRRLADIQEEICFRAVWRWAILESKLRGWKEKKS